jgi:hypothetical protein
MLRPIDLCSLVSWDFIFLFANTKLTFPSRNFQVLVISHLHTKWIWWEYHITRYTFTRNLFKEGEHFYRYRGKTRCKHEVEIKSAVLKYTSHIISCPHFNVFIYVTPAAFPIPTTLDLLTCFPFSLLCVQCIVLWHSTTGWGIIRLTPNFPMDPRWRPLRWRPWHPCTLFVQLYPQPLYTASQVRMTSRSWDKGVLTDLCLTRLMPHPVLCVTLFLLCITLFIFLLLYCDCLWCACCYPNWCFPCFYSTVRQMPGYNSQRRGLIHTSQIRL